MNTPQPLAITVVTPSYNQVQFLERTIRSVLDQDYPRLQYIVMDGGSIDGSVDIIRRYARHLDYWVSEPDRGQVDAINKGLRRATGDVVAWLNSDDEYVPGALYRVAEVYAAEAARGGTGRWPLVYGRCEFIDEVGRHLSDWPYVEGLGLQRVVADNLVPQPSCFIPTSALRALGPPDDRLHFAFDYDFWVRALAAGYEMRAVPHLLSRYRLHGASKTQSVRAGFDREMERVHARLLRGPRAGEVRRAVAQCYRRFASEHLHWFGDPTAALRYSVRMAETSVGACDRAAVGVAARSLARLCRDVHARRG